MAKAGEDVTFIDGWPEHVETMRRDGLHLTGTTDAEECTVPVNALHFSDVQSLSKGDPVDIAFVCMKSYETEMATHLIKPYLAPDGYIVSLQNCMNEEFIANIVGWGKVVGCIAAKISVELRSAGHVHRNVPIHGNSHTVFRAGEVHGGDTPRVHEVAQLCSYTDSAMVTDNIWGQRWTKLCLNASSNGVSASTGLGGVDLVAQPHLRDVKIKLAAESIRVGRASGFKLEKLGGIDADVYVAATDPGARKTIEDSYIAGAAKGNPDARPSMGQDMMKGRRTEIDYMNGLVVQKGREAGIATPTNEGLIAAVKKVERGEAAASPDLLAGL
jgi:2-dehydropantoate 2-reductase